MGKPAEALVVDFSSVDNLLNSNHTLRSTGEQMMKKQVFSALGTGDANLLLASLSVNASVSWNGVRMSFGATTHHAKLVGTHNRLSGRQMPRSDQESKSVANNKKARRKIIWSHASGKLNLGDTALPTQTIPDVLSWFGYEKNESNAKLIQYHEPPLPEKELGRIRLDSIYRILRSMPVIFNEGKKLLGKKEEAELRAKTHEWKVKRQALKRERDVLHAEMKELEEMQRGRLRERKPSCARRQRHGRKSGRQ